MTRIPFLKPRKRKNQPLFHKQKPKDSNMITAKILADSINVLGDRITTFELVYPRFIHAEFMTHRQLNRNASSSRAIPTARLIEQVRTEPVMPVHWGKNRKGMQATEEVEDTGLVKAIWHDAAKKASDFAEVMNIEGVHKQVVNRILEPFTNIRVVVTATSWNNFFGLRIHEDAQPEINELASKMKISYDTSSPIELVEGDWHLPYITSPDNNLAYAYCKLRRVTRDEPSKAEIMQLLTKVSAARCARASYNNFEGKPSTIEEDLALFDKLVGSQPIHASPTEHQATPMSTHRDVNKLDPHTWEAGVSHMDRSGQLYSGSLCGWIQFRKLIPNECIN